MALNEEVPLANMSQLLNSLQECCACAVDLPRAAFKGGMKRPVSKMHVAWWRKLYAEGSCHSRLHSLYGAIFLWPTLQVLQNPLLCFCCVAVAMKSRKTWVMLYKHSQITTPSWLVPASLSKKNNQFRSLIQQKGHQLVLGRKLHPSVQLMTWGPLDPGINCTFHYKCWKGSCATAMGECFAYVSADHGAKRFATRIMKYLAN